MADPRKRKNYGFRQPGEETPGGFGEDIDFMDGFSTVAKYGVPLAVLLQQSQQAKKLREKANVDLEEPELLTGRVRSLRRPNFGMRRRDPQGSLLAEYVAGQKFGDAFQREQEINFEVADDSARIQQENQVADRTNQSIMTKNQIRNQEKLHNSGMAAQELLGLNIPFQQEALLGLYHNIQSDSAQNSYVNSLERSQGAAAVLTDPNSSEEDRKWATDYIMGKLGKQVPGKVPTRQKGGKLVTKTKFYAKPG